MKNPGHEHGSGSARESADRPKAMATFSGGLDSLLAAVLVQRVGVEVVLLHVQHLFSTDGGGRRRLATAAEQAGLPLRIVDASEEHLDVIRHPRHGYGRGMNPCVDCRIFILRVAKRVMEEEGAQFVVSGEVLGQRPKSQHRKALAQAAEESGLGDRLVRPLSARLLPETLPVREGWLRSEDLLAIEGRSREVQMALAERWGIPEYPQPAGGCVLVEKAYAARVRDAFTHRGPDNVDLEAFRLFRIGRHFRLSDRTKAIIGRNEQENDALTSLAQGRILLEPVGTMGPITLVESDDGPSDRELHLVASLAGRYCDVTGESITFEVRSNEGAWPLEAEPLTPDDPRIPAWRIGM